MNPVVFPELGSSAVIKRSGERGTVVGQVTYLRTQPQVLLQYTDRTGCAKDAWFFLDEISFA